MADYYRKYKSLYSTTLSAGIGTGTGETITLASVTDVPTDTEITITIDRVNSSGVETPSSMERITGTLSGSNLTSYTRAIDGTTDQAHSSGAVVEMIWNAADLNQMVTGILVQHRQTGVHKAITVTSADNSNEVAAVFTQSDVTNNPIATQIENNGTNHGLYIQQDGVLAATKNALYVYSNAIQINSQLLYVFNDNASTSTVNVTFKTDGTGTNLWVHGTGNFSAGANIYSENDGTGHNLYVLQDGVLAANKYVVYVLSTVAQTASNLVYIHQDHASSDQDVVVIVNDGTGGALFINQVGVSAANQYSLFVYSNVAQTTATLAVIQLDHASSTTNALLITNDGTGTTLYVDANGTPDSAAIRLDGCTGTSAVNPESTAETGFIKVNIDGTARVIPYYAIT